jgi:hypothetical protein
VYRLPASLRKSLRASCHKAKDNAKAKPESKFCKWLGPAAGDAYENLKFKDGTPTTAEEREGLVKLELQFKALEKEIYTFRNKKYGHALIKMKSSWKLPEELKEECKRCDNLVLVAYRYLTFIDTAENYNEISVAVNRACQENRTLMNNIAADAARVSAYLGATKAAKTGQPPATTSE